MITMNFKPSITSGPESTAKSDVNYSMNDPESLSEYKYTRFSNYLSAVKYGNHEILFAIMSNIKGGVLALTPAQYTTHYTPLY